MSERVADTGGCERFFNRTDWLAFWTAFAVSLVIYVYTLAPSVTLEDGGELAVAADWLGVPHPPGYPSWTMIGWVFARLFSFVTFRGQPNPTYGIAMASAVFGAISAGLVALLICRSGRDILRWSQQISHSMSLPMEHAICWAGGVASSLLFAFTPIMWSQSVIVEAYALNAFFLILVMLLIYMWMCRPSDKLLYLVALTFGVGLTNYQVLLLAAMALAIVVMFKDFELFRDFAVAGGPIVAVIVLLQMGLLPPVEHPTHPSWYLYLGLNGALLIFTYFLLPRGRTVAVTILLAELGMAVYAYMPIVSDLRNPPMNWGYPRTWEGFKHALRRGQYEQISPTDLFSLRYLQQIGTYLADLRLNYTLLVSLIAFLPFCSWRFRLKPDGRWIEGMKLAAILVTASLCLLPLGRVAPLYKLPALGVFLMLAIGAITMTVQRYRVLLQDHLTAPHARPWERMTAAAVLAVAALGYLALVGRKLLDILGPLRTGQAIPEGGGMAFFLQLCLIPVLIAAPLILMALAVKLLSLRDCFEFTVDIESQKWMVSTLIAFATLSLGLIALANLKMDIQDTFIQRVKFISSHLLFSFWIGYGLIFLLAYIDGKTVRKPTAGRPAGGHPLTVLCIGVTALLPLLPILANQYNKKLIEVYGGADQHGRDFGWQFGNYQLRGAEAILEELSPDEEPLPNPVYPLAMGRNAIFFGGTDPGRFVPTYMIYSARVREDVHLITQNALADGTYMSVMRDLYGNNIWIPSVVDSANAFSRYVHEVDTGQRPESAGITREGGRVQISGVMGVMEINGILAQDIFDYNAGHDFYVEESYVIRWMYPHLIPHGLIMQINRQPLPLLTPEMIRNDMDFWDWYTRRMKADPMFVRDVVARKSFSKLRSAIAGLYSYRGLQEEAKHAFQEALVLYDLSPEANFRLAEVYLRTGDFAKARTLMVDFGAKDPANDRVQDFINQIDGMQAHNARIEAIEAEAQLGGLDVQRIMELADLYRHAGRMDRFMQLTMDLLQDPDLPAFVLLPLAQLFEQAGRLGEMHRALGLCMERMPPEVPPEVFTQIARMLSRVNDLAGMRKALKAYLDRQPNDWRAWLDMATIELNLGDSDQASVSLGVAIRYGGDDAQRAIQINAQLSPLLQRRASRAQGIFGLGL